METISTQQEFINMQSGEDYIITEDIDMQGVNGGEFDASNDIVVGDLSNSTIYGRGNEIINFNVSGRGGGGMTDYGIIRNASNVTIKNLTIRGASVTSSPFGPEYTSILIAKSQEGVVLENIHFRDCNVVANEYGAALVGFIEDPIQMKMCSFHNVDVESEYEMAGVACADSTGLTFLDLGSAEDIAFKDCTVNSTGGTDGGGRPYHAALFMGAPRPELKRVYVDCDLGSEEYIYSSQGNSVDSSSNSIKDVYYNGERVAEDRIYVDSRFRSGDATLENIIELSGDQVNNIEPILGSELESMGFNLEDFGLDSGDDLSNVELSLRDISLNFNYEDIWLEQIEEFPEIKDQITISDVVNVSGDGVIVSDGMGQDNFLLSGEQISVIEGIDESYVNISGSDFGY